MCIIFATLHDHVTNYSFWWSFCPFTFCFEIFNLSLLFKFTNFSPSHCHAMSPTWGILTSTVLREGQVRAPLSKACRLTMGHIEPPGAHSHWGGSAEVYHSLPSTAKVSTSTGMHMDSFTLGLCMSHCSHVLFSHSLYNYITFFGKNTCFSFVC